MFNDILENISKMIEVMKRQKSNYFTTLAGSNTITVLASFEKGREVLYDILKTEDLPICLFGYVQRDASTEVQNKVEDRAANALTVLIEKLDYNIYELLFYRVVLHSKSLGIGSCSVLTDTLLFLQGRGERGTVYML